MQQGKLLGLADSIGLADLQAVSRDLWAQEAVATAAIEGEKLDLETVRSSVLHRMGLAEPVRPDRHIDGLVEVMHDAIDRCDEALDEDRLCRWHASLFPGGTSGVRRIAVGRYREHADAMQIGSGRPGREVVHYTAPPSPQVATEMGRFLSWFQASQPVQGTVPSAMPNGLIRAAIVHLWFETVHPFEDGNGRLGRAIVDMAIAQDLGAPTRLFSLSRQLLETRAAYYDALNRAQCGGPDVTEWVRWFVQAFASSCLWSQSVMKQAGDKDTFRRHVARLPINGRQQKVLSRLLDAGDGAFLGGLTADKYGKITGVSKATATRDLADLLRHELLIVQGLGKATRYAINVPGWNQSPVDG